MALTQTDTSARRSLPGSHASLNPSEVHRGSRGSLYCYQVTPTTIYVQSVGHLDLAAAEALKAFANRGFARVPKTAIFHD
ncbi:MAG: hypothetical protein H5U40_00190 [Polyangiaceae bacterium]|nr:hypothetical protein [Polyangiaceae bacterium]